MADVTFGVKVSEEMKNELSELMKESTVTGKEFMGMLIASYKLDKAREESQLFDSDLKELQGLIKRIQGIFVNMIDKSNIQVETYEREHEDKIRIKEEAYEEVLEKIEEKERDIETHKKQLDESEKALSKLKKQLTEAEDEIVTYKQQIKNQVLLHTKFEEEVKHLQDQIEGYERLEEEIKERNEECTKLKNRNDEISSEVWFLKREIEKLGSEKEQILQKHENEVAQLKSQHALTIKNELLEQKLAYTEEVSQLKEEINGLKDKLIKCMDKMSE